MVVIRNKFSFQILNIYFHSCIGVHGANKTLPIRTAMDYGKLA